MTLIKHLGLEKYQLLKKPKKRDWRTSLYLYIGDPGTGKSRRAMSKYPEAYWLPKGQGGSSWFDGYDGHEHIIIDDFYGWLPYDLLLRMADRYPLLVPTKGAHVPFLAKVIIITSNKKWDQWYDWNRCVKGALERRIDQVYNFPEINNFT